MVHIDRHPVRPAGTRALAPPGGPDVQGAAVFGRHVVFQDVVQNGLRGKLRYRGVEDMGVLLMRQKDVIGQSAEVVLLRFPYAQNGPVDVVQHLPGRFVLPLGGGSSRAVVLHRGLRSFRVIEQARRAILAKAHVGTLVHVLVIGQPHALLEHLIQGAADKARLLHIHKRYPQGGGEDVRLNPGCFSAHPGRRALPAFLSRRVCPPR